MNSPEAPESPTSSAAVTPHPEPANTPWLTIATVVRNDPEALELTLASVAAQDTSVCEHLIIDGGSNDGTAEIAAAWASEHWWVRVVSEPDTGIYNAMNKAIALARGQWLLFLNAGDDFAASDSVALAHTDWLKHNYQWGRYRIQMVDDQREATRPVDDRDLDPILLERADQDPQHQGALMSRAMLLDLGGFDERYPIVADYDLMRRALHAGYRPWEGHRVLTLVDASGVSTGNWRQSIKEVHRVRTAGAGPAQRVAASAQTGKRWTVVAGRRGLRRAATATLGVRRLNRWRGLHTEGA